MLRHDIDKVPQPYSYNLNANPKHDNINPYLYPALFDTGGSTRNK